MTYGVRLISGGMVPNWHLSVTVEDGLPGRARRPLNHEDWPHKRQARKGVSAQQGFNIAEAEGTL